MPASPDPDLAFQAAKATVDLYSRATETLLGQVARRLARGITQPGWAEAKLADLTGLRNAAQAELDRLQRGAPRAIQAAIRTGWAAGADDVAGETGNIPIRTNSRALDALVDETVRQVTSTHPRILRSTLDTYRAVIAETSAADVLTGSRSRVQATQQALDRFARQGITGYVDGRDRRWSLDSYAEMATRTAVGRAQVAGSLDRYQAAGRDLVLVSDAPSECEACRPWEGKVLSISGTTPPGTRLSDGVEVTATVGEAQRGGLHHPNCRHRLRAYIPGLSRRMVDTEDPAGDRARQEQRRLERGVREWKRREAAAMTPEARAAAGRHRTEWQGRLGQHIDREGLKRQRHRER